MTAIRPPEFAPRLAYAALLLAADRVVLADTLPFSRQGFQNRARIVTAQGAAWLTVPRRHGGLAVPLREVDVVPDGWRERHRRALRAAYGQALFYEHVAPEWEAVLATPGSLADLAAASVRFVARWLRAGAEIVRASELPGAPATLAAVLGATEPGALLTLPESAERDRQRAAALGVDTRVLRVEAPDPGLSLLDWLMTDGPAAADRLRAATRLGGPDPPGD